MSGVSPIAGLRTMARGPLYMLGLLGAVKALSLILMADGIATAIVSLIGRDNMWQTGVATGLIGAVLRAVVTWATHVASLRAVIGAKRRIRSQLAQRLAADPASDDPGRNVGAMTTLATRGIDELDKYYTVFLPALVSAATIPLLVGARILVADPLSALVIVLTVPLIPVFMTLIGMHTQERVEAAGDVLARLSDHLVELARGLPVLIGLGRVHDQTEALRRISDEHRRTSVRTLRTAFLSSLALELVSTISVAVVAVLIGVRLIAGSMPLHIGLIALVLAAECFIPFREIGSAFHASQDGVDALRRVRTVLDAPEQDSRIVRRRGTRVRADGLTIRYADRAEPAVSGLSFDTQPRGITLLHGRSGAGKSTVLAALAGILPSSAAVDGGIVGPDETRVAYLPQHPNAVDTTARDELSVYGAGLDTQEHEDILDSVGLRELANTDPALFSPGEMRRLAFARILARVRTGAELVLLDEPTAHLDERSAALIRLSIAGLAASTTVVVASHDPAVHALADRWVHIDGEGTAAASTQARPAKVDPEQTRYRSASARDATHRDGINEAAHPYRELAAFLLPVLPRLVFSALLGTLAVAFAIALSAVSGWLIVRASEHPPILYLLVAIVGVRFFGIGRGVLRWCERLLAHDAVFAATTVLRVRLWQGLASRGPADRSLLGPGSALDRLISDADRVRDLAPRVVMPPLIGVASTAAAGVALGTIYPPAGWPMLALAIVGLVIAPLTAALTDRTAVATADPARSKGVRAFAAMLTSAVDLKANGVDGVVRRRLDILDAERARADKRSAWSIGLGNALVVLVCSSAAMSMIPLAAHAVSAGTLPAALVAVLVLTPLGLIDPLLNCVDAAQQWPTLKRVLGRIGMVTTAANSESDEDGDSHLPSVLSMCIENLGYRYPRATTPAFSGATANLERGEWLVVTGPSGSGKSTLLSVLLRFLTPTYGSYRLNDTDTTAVSGHAVRERVAWCPQEGHLFDSSLRANLLIARPRDDAPNDAELTETLERVGLGELLAGLPNGLDTRLGSAGAYLSGGQRQRVAVARTLLARSDVLLIDEPTAHLDEASAKALMADLRASASDKITVLVTHQPAGISAADRRIVLGAQPVNTRVGVVLTA